MRTTTALLWSIALNFCLLAYLSSQLSARQNPVALQAAFVPRGPTVSAPRCASRTAAYAVPKRTIGPSKKTMAPAKKTVAPPKKTVAAPKKTVAAPAKKTVATPKKTVAPLKKTVAPARKTVAPKAPAAPQGGGFFSFGGGAQVNGFYWWLTLVTRDLQSKPKTAGRAAGAAAPKRGVAAILLSSNPLYDCF